MKKLVIASLIFASVSASATDLGITAARGVAGDSRTYGGVTLGQHYGPVSATVGIEQSSVGSNDQTRYSLVGGYDVAKFGDVTVTPKLGVAYLDNQTSSNGFAMTTGVGVSVPVTNTVTVGFDVERQFGQNKVSEFNNNRFVASVKQVF